MNTIYKVPLLWAALGEINKKISSSDVSNKKKKEKRLMELMLGTRSGGQEVLPGELILIFRQRY